MAYAAEMVLAILMTSTMSVVVIVLAVAIVAWQVFRSLQAEPAQHVLPADARQRKVESSRHTYSQDDEGLRRRHDGIPTGETPPAKRHARSAGYKESDPVEYFSDRHNAWLPAIVIKVDLEGKILIDLKPNAWLSKEQQDAKIRRAQEDRYSEPPFGQAPARRLPSPPPAPRRGERAEPAARDARTDPYAREDGDSESRRAAGRDAHPGLPAHLSPSSSSSGTPSRRARSAGHEAAEALAKLRAAMNCKTEKEWRKAFARCSELGVRVPEGLQCEQEEDGVRCDRRYRHGGFCGFYVHAP